MPYMSSKHPQNKLKSKVIRCILFSCVYLITRANARAAARLWKKTTVLGMVKYTRCVL